MSSRPQNKIEMRTVYVNLSGNALPHGCFSRDALSIDSGKSAPGFRNASYLSKNFFPVSSGNERFHDERMHCKFRKRHSGYHHNRFSAGYDGKVFLLLDLIIAVFSLCCRQKKSRRRRISCLCHGWMLWSDNFIEECPIFQR